MRVRRLGESAMIVDDLGQVAAWRVADRLHAISPSGFVDSAASYESVGVFFDPDQTSPGQLADVIQSCLSACESESEPRLHRIPVCYEMGEDLPEVGRALGLTGDDIIALHTGTRYTCAAVGFQPGFGYLGDLPEALRGIPRRASPRVRVPAGSVAITGSQTAVYPSESPGGWALIGRTPLVMVDVDGGYFPIRAGDQVEFFPVSASEFEVMRGQRL